MELKQLFGKSLSRGTLRFRLVTWSPMLFVEFPYTHYITLHHVVDLSLENEYFILAFLVRLLAHLHKPSTVSLLPSCVEDPATAVKLCNGVVLDIQKPSVAIIFLNLSYYENNLPLLIISAHHLSHTFS